MHHVDVQYRRGIYSSILYISYGASFPGSVFEKGEESPSRAGTKEEKRASISWNMLWKEEGGGCGGREGRVGGHAVDEELHQQQHHKQQGEQQQKQQQQQHLQTNNDLEEDTENNTAAMFVMLYLLLISALLIIAIIIGAYVVVQYGLIVFVAACTAVFALSIVAIVVAGVITNDVKLTTAQSRIKQWHITCKDKILCEIDKIRDDYVAYSSGQMLLLTYDKEFDSLPDGENCLDEILSSTATTKKKIQLTRIGYRPKSLLFRTVIEFNPFTKSSSKQRSSVDGSNNNTAATTINNTKRSSKLSSWGRRKNSTVNDVVSGQGAATMTTGDDGYDPPTIV